MFIADLHIHSKYSRATSRDCVPELLALWAAKKGINLLGTGDFTHPAWRKELKEKLVPAEEGLYMLKGKGRESQPRFIISGEISSIYKKNGRVRKVHNLILLPGLEEAEALARRLESVGNLHSDGRPILGLDSRDLLEITLETCPRAIFIPAHIWTPHFSLFGAFSGFDTIEECFEDLTPHIRALETGLSSDPPMNWRLSALDTYALVSNSDAHSPQKLGREANLFQTDLSYPALRKALDGRGAKGFAGTVEFFPEEGKYHYDGHRNCKLCLKPDETERAAGVCPVCGGKLTIGVLHRVQQLADRAEGYRPDGALSFESLVPLPEVIAASTGISATGKKAAALYEGLLQSLGPEFYILREAPLAEIEQAAGACVAEGIRRMRAGCVGLSPGYDGEYGKIQLLNHDEIGALSGQLCLFQGGEKQREKPKKSGESAAFIPKMAENKPVAEPQAAYSAAPPAGLNTEQQEAVLTCAPAVAVVAGPGTGKTKTLVSRILHLVKEKGARPSEITAVTFTNKAAGEMRQRLEEYFGGKSTVRFMNIGTFHAISLRLLEAWGKKPVILDEYGARAIADELLGELSLKVSPQKLLSQVSKIKNGAKTEQQELPEGLYDAYCAKLKQAGAMDFDDILLETLALCQNDCEMVKHKMQGFTHLLVDEFQDINDVQYRLLQAWSRQSKTTFVIGDPDQAVYGFRGSDPLCFQRFQEEMQAQRICLSRNYRSTPEILQCGLSVISQNRKGERFLEAQRESGARVRLLTAADEFSEALFITKEINRMVGGVDMLDAQTLGIRREKPVSFSDIAVLYRTHRQAEILERNLRQEGIPYVVTGRDRTLSDRFVRGTVCFFRSLLNPFDQASLRSCLKDLWNCPDGAALKLAEYCAAEHGEEIPDNLLKEPALFKWFSLSGQFRQRCQKEKPAKLLLAWAQEAELDNSPAMEHLAGMAVLQNDMASFLQNLTLGAEGDISRCGGKRYVSDSVFLMTLHGAKGLEFPVVFLCGVKKGIVPLDAPGRVSDPEEERRLFYVGITRARDELILLTNPSPSPFLGDLPGTCLLRGRAAEQKENFGGKQLSLFG